MKIQNNYNPYSGTEYHRPYTPHGAEHVREREEEAEISGGQKKQEAGHRKGRELIRQFWDSMGDDENSQTEKTDVPGEEGLSGKDTGRRIWAISASVRNLLPAYITEKWEDVKDRIKEGAGAAFQRFNRGKDAFLALSDPGGRFRGKKEEKHRGREQPGRGMRRAKPEVLSGSVPDTHLMDSYSKTGEYCRLNDNLSYRRERHEANRRAFSESREKEAAEALKDAPKRLDKRL